MLLKIFQVTTKDKNYKNLTLGALECSLHTARISPGVLTVEGTMAALHGYRTNECIKSDYLASTFEG